MRFGSEKIVSFPKKCLFDSNVRHTIHWFWFTKISGIKHKPHLISKHAT